MTPDQMRWLLEQIAVTVELLGQEISETAAAVLARELAHYPKPLLERALHRVRNEHTGRFTLKAIVDRIDELSGRFAPNEAWALALQSLDERNTVVWTNEIRAAWGVAQQVMQVGDKVGGRMAFVAAYERIVKDARDARQMPQVEVSEG